jgi:hypothetical protein
MYVCRVHERKVDRSVGVRSGLGVGWGGCGCGQGRGARGEWPVVRGGGGSVYASLYKQGASILTYTAVGDDLLAVPAVGGHRTLPECPGPVGARLPVLVQRRADQHPTYIYKCEGRMRGRGAIREWHSGSALGLSSAVQISPQGERENGGERWRMREGRREGDADGGEHGNAVFSEAPRVFAPPCAQVRLTLQLSALSARLLTLPGSFTASLTFTP